MNFWNIHCDEYSPPLQIACWCFQAPAPPAATFHEHLIHVATAFVWLVNSHKVLTAVASVICKSSDPINILQKFSISSGKRPKAFFLHGRLWLWLPLFPMLWLYLWIPDFSLRMGDRCTEPRLGVGATSEWPGISWQVTRWDTAHPRDAVGEPRSSHKPGVTDNALWSCWRALTQPFLQWCTRTFLFFWN